MGSTSRDPAYGGRFFSGVRTTRIYCRPVCPVRPARPQNVSFYPSAAAAEAAGFRPCLRCRPETAPFCAAWNGSLTTAQRALRLIADGALDAEEASVEAFAAGLGVGARHLARLFARHVGATPTQVARTMRVQRAKRLLDTTDLPMSEIALRAGFGSLRRFNAVFAEVYRAPPSEIRRRRGSAVLVAPTSRHCKQRQILSPKSGAQSAEVPPASRHGSCVLLPPESGHRHLGGREPV